MEGAPGRVAGALGPGTVAADSNNRLAPAVRRTEGGWRETQNPPLTDAFDRVSVCHACHSKGFTCSFPTLNQKNYHLVFSTPAPPQHQHVRHSRFHQQGRPGYVIAVLLSDGAKMLTRTYSRWPLRRLTHYARNQGESMADGRSMSSPRRSRRLLPSTARDRSLVPLRVTWSRVPSRRRLLPALAT